MAETTTQISRPAPFIETMGKTFGEGVMQLGQKPIDTSLFQPFHKIPLNETLNRLDQQINMEMYRHSVIHLRYN